MPSLMMPTSDRNRLEPRGPFETSGYISPGGKSCSDDSSQNVAAAVANIIEESKNYSEDTQPNDLDSNPIKKLTSSLFSNKNGKISFIGRKSSLKTKRKLSGSVQSGGKLSIGFRNLTKKQNPYLMPVKTTSDSIKAKNDGRIKRLAKSIKALQLQNDMNLEDEKRTESRRAFGLLRKSTSDVNVVEEKKKMSSTLSSVIQGALSAKKPLSLRKSSTSQSEDVSDSGAHVRHLVPLPPAKPSNKSSDVNKYLTDVQHYINNLGYQKVGEPVIRVDTRLSIKSLMEVARNLIKSGNQIKCLHALLLGIHFTNSLPHVERFPIYFRSSCNDKEFKHVVLGIYFKGNFGAIGISRDPDLQDKPIAFSRLTDLLKDYYNSYINSGHQPLEIKIGGIITHDQYSLESFPPKTGTLKLDILPNAEMESLAEQYSKKLRSKMAQDSLRQNSFYIPVKASDFRVLRKARLSNHPPQTAPKMIKKNSNQKDEEAWNSSKLDNRAKSAGKIKAKIFATGKPAAKKESLEKRSLVNTVTSVQKSGSRKTVSSSQKRE